MFKILCIGREDSMCFKLKVDFFFLSLGGKRDDLQLPEKIYQVNSFKKFKIA